MAGQLIAADPSGMLIGATKLPHPTFKEAV
jgi:hypothetical protein